MSFEQWLVAQGVDIKTLDEAKKEEFRKKFEAEQSAGTANPPERTFTQEQVNALLAKNKRALQDENKALKDQLTAVQADLSDLRTLIPSSGSGGSGQGNAGTGGNTDLAGRVELLERKHARELQDRDTKLKQLEGALESEKRLRRETERDKELGEALTGCCIDGTAGKRYFLPQIEWDDDESKWRYRTRNGNLVSISDGVAEEMPDFLKPSSMQGGGSGVKTGSPRQQARAKQLETAKTELATLQATAKKSGKQRDVLLFQKKKREVQLLEAEVSPVR